MANPEHLSLLTRSATDWDEWRADNTDIQPDLSKADLRRADLSSMDLSRADLGDANLSGADLSLADLGGANLSGADLRRADLSRADLSGANLSGADLRGGDLRRAASIGSTCLERANLSGADLRNTMLIDATLRKADLSKADLSGADLSEANLGGATLFAANLAGANLRGARLTSTRFEKADLSGADLQGALITQANLVQAKLTKADLREANLSRTDLGGADLGEANLGGVNLGKANLSETNLSQADLTGATLERSMLVKTACNKAIFSGCRIHGISAWDVQLEGAQQTNLIITPSGEPEITVDNLEVGQFIYLLLNNPRIRDVIDTVTSKVVLILGRFTPDRKVVLDAIRDRLRTRNYSPVVFDFEKPITRDLTETVMTLAAMAKFVIADLTDPKCIPHELMSFVPNLPSVPVLPLLHTSQKQEYAMFQDLQRRCHWVMETVRYQDQETLLRSLESTVILPAELKAKELIATQRK